VILVYLEDAIGIRSELKLKNSVGHCRVAFIAVIQTFFGYMDNSAQSGFSLKRAENCVFDIWPMVGWKK
jgi:hypothetical protein